MHPATPFPIPPHALVPKKVDIRSRRYLGAKTRLLDFLYENLRRECGRFDSFADLFGGTGVVAHHFNRPGLQIVANDILAANVVAMRCFLSTTRVDEERLKGLLKELRQLDAREDNYFSDCFGDRFFTMENARRIGAVREQIVCWARDGKIETQEEDVLLTSLLYATDRVANTCGHYDAYREKLDMTQSLVLALPRIDQEANLGNRVYQMDANELVKEIETDVLYIDPPYNSRQYSDTYHLLENLVRWEKPEVFGKARKMDRKGLKSLYCSGRHAPKAFSELVAHARCRHIVVSYNNMAKKGDPRSNACLPDETIITALEARGQVKVLEKPFVHFTAGLREIEGHTERIFFCRVTR